VALPGLIFHYSLICRGSLTTQNSNITGDPALKLLQWANETLFITTVPPAPFHHR
jgi:hypothetical protein